jgi:hypothetical protein
METLKKYKRVLRVYTLHARLYATDVIGMRHRLSWVKKIIPD